VSLPAICLLTALGRWLAAAAAAAVCVRVRVRVCVCVCVIDYHCAARGGSARGRRWRRRRRRWRRSGRGRARPWRRRGSPSARWRRSRWASRWTRWWPVRSPIWLLIDGHCAAVLRGAHLTRQPADAPAVGCVAAAAAAAAFRCLAARRQRAPCKSMLARAVKAQRGAHTMVEQGVGCSAWHVGVMAEAEARFDEALGQTSMHAVQSVSHCRATAASHRYPAALGKGCTLLPLSSCLLTNHVSRISYHRRRRGY
jgi:hypothetical protein